MRRVILESPYAANPNSWLPSFIQRWQNRRYARACVRDSLARGEAPIASHLLYTQRGILRDNVASERQWGIDAGLAWREVAAYSVVYVDRGTSNGMQYGIGAAKKSGKEIVFRCLYPTPNQWQAAPDHPMCRCTIFDDGSIFEDEKAGRFRPASSLSEPLI